MSDDTKFVLALSSLFLSIYPLFIALGYLARLLAPFYS